MSDNSIVRMIRKLNEYYGPEAVRKMSTIEKIGAYNRMQTRKKEQESEYKQLTLKELYPDIMEEEK